MNLPRVQLFTRQGCHLCDQAKAVLLRYGLTPEEIDIDIETEYLPTYTDWVPVVVIDGQERFRGRIDEMLLRRLLNR